MPTLETHREPTLKSSVLLVGHPNPAGISFGADFAAHTTEARGLFRETRYPVIAVSIDRENPEQLLSFFKFLTEASPETQPVLITQKASSDFLKELLKHTRAFKILRSFSDPVLDVALQEALEEHMLIRQNQVLLKLIKEQNEQLTQLSSQLEARVEKRQRYLVQAHRKLLRTTQHIEALQRALVAVHRAQSVGEMERLVNEALTVALKLAWTRIIFSHQEHFDHQIEREKNLFSILATPLLRDSERIGHIYFARKSKKDFSKDETDFLLQISEAISLSIARLTTLHLSEEVKQQWETTFDSITSPVSVMAENYDIVRVNRAYAEKSKKNVNDLIAQKCFKVFFDRESPCENCQLGEQFRIQQKGRHEVSLSIYEVSSQNISHEKTSGTFVNIYRDVSHQLKLERQIVESAKMAELGTIGSSIAHELNNPIGGIITFLQLIKMDLKGDEPYFSDISEMEKAAIRCKDIIHNLLSFTRKPSTEERELFDLKDAIRKAVQIIELQSKSMGVKLLVHFEPEETLIEGNSSLLSQAIMNLLQTCMDGIIKQMKKEISFSGVIEIHLGTRDQKYWLEISNNGPGLRPEKRTDIGIRQTVAAQIISELNGSMEIISGPDSTMTARISLPRPVF